MNCRSSLCLLALAIGASAAHAEPIYVIEQLVVSVASEPGGEGERIGQVKSGDKLELIERQGDEAHVRLPSGKDGWVKGSYLSLDEPVTHRLNERVAEIDKLKHEGDQFKREAEQLKQEVARLESELAAARVAHNTALASPPPPALATPTPVRETVFLRAPDRPGQTTWSFILGLSAVMLLVGFVIGWQTLDRRIRRKYGGLRIY
jgi:hypothetical protein